MLVTAGKRGDICYYDLRQRTLRHKFQVRYIRFLFLNLISMVCLHVNFVHFFQAHETAVKCLALDPNETVFCSGSADGDIKVRNRVVNKNFFYQKFFLRFGTYPFIISC